MNLSVKFLVIIVIVSAVVGGLIVRKFAPQEVIKTVIQTQVVDHEVVKDHIIKVTKEIDNPNGTKEIDTETDEDRQSDENKQTNTTQTETKTIPVAASRPNWFVTGGAGLQFSAVTSGPVYNLGLNKRLVGPVYWGMWGNGNSPQNAAAGFQFGWEF